MTLDHLNNLAPDKATELFSGCCRCARWAMQMEQARPFQSESKMLESAEKLWASATEKEKLEAFSGHPQIGDLNGLRNRYASTASHEQGQIRRADEKVLELLRDENQQYLETHGFIFIVCATGKSAREMLKLLQQRLENDREIELDNAAREQAAITRLRLIKSVEG